MGRKDNNKQSRQVRTWQITYCEHKPDEPVSIVIRDVPFDATDQLNFSKEGIPVYSLVDPPDLARQSGMIKKLEDTDTAPRRVIYEAHGQDKCGRHYFVQAPGLTRPQRIALPPGVFLNQVTQFLLTRDAHRHYVRPVIADMQIEYCDALAAGHLWHARWIAVRGYLLVVPGYLYGCIARAAKRMFST